MEAGRSGERNQPGAERILRASGFTQTRRGDLCQRILQENIPMAIATSGDRENAEAALDRLGVLSYFEGICTCSETGWGKSRPDVYFAAERLLHTNPKKHGFLRMRSMPYGQQKGLDFRQSGCTTGQMKKIRERSGRRRIFT